MNTNTEEHQDKMSHPFEICRQNKDNSVLNGTHGYPGDNVYVAKTLFKTIAFSNNLLLILARTTWNIYVLYQSRFTYPWVELPRLFSLSRFHRQLSACRLQRRPQRRPVRRGTENKKIKKIIQNKRHY